MSNGQKIHTLKKKISDRLEEQFLWHGVMAEMLKELKESFTV